jgi:peroxiredoxin
VTNHQQHEHGGQVSSPSVDNFAGTGGHPVDRLLEREAAQRLTRRLVGSTLPALIFAGTRGEPVALDRYVSRALVLYLYPGSETSPDGGNDSLLTDAAQHRSFRERLAELAHLKFVVLGLSSESPHAQIVNAEAQRLSHVLVNDPELRLAAALGLPTATIAGAEYYRRLTLIVNRGRIGHVFFPVLNVQCGADQVLTWAKVNGL